KVISGLKLLLTRRAYSWVLRGLGAFLVISMMTRHLADRGLDHVFGVTLREIFCVTIFRVFL
ncbi:742_t:CDS:1, partial [Dentiscutata heterogama]